MVLWNSSSLFLLKFYDTTRCFRVVNGNVPINLSQFLMLITIAYDNDSNHKFSVSSKEQFALYLNELINKYEELYSVSIIVKTTTQEQIEEAQRNSRPLDESDPKVHTFLENIKKTNL